METEKPPESAGWLGGSGNRIVINEAAGKEAEMKPWSERIPAAIAKAKELVGPDDWYVNDDTTAVITAGEVALASALWGEFFSGTPEEFDATVAEGQLDQCDEALSAYCEKIERLGHDEKK
ncbi:hypothetical protein LCGC14_2834060 [marine sediment metagenome]|uniref:Uncharacterized protein n=1 Tax=marine sediment metagenome TaxID=412755 RepID=A0A0F9ALP7_9ZZZZ